MKRCFYFLMLLFVMGGFQNLWGEPYDSYGIVQGIITNPEEGILRNAYVTANVDTGTVAYDYTDNNGQYTLFINLTYPYIRDSSIVDIAADNFDYNPDTVFNIVVKFLEIDTVDIVLSHEYGPIQGYVYDLNFGTPIKNVYVSADGDPLKSATTDIYGFYNLTVRDSSNVLNGYEISFSHGEYLDTTVNVIVSQDRESLDMILDRVNWYVAMDGDDDWLGSSEDPFATIQKGVDSAVDDDTVFIAPDTMIGTGNRGVYINDKKIIIRGTEDEDTGLTTVLDCNYQDNGFFIEYDRGSSIVGLTIINGFTPGPGGGIHCRYAQSIVTIDSCQFYNNSSSTQGGGIAVQTENTLIRITYCAIMYNYAGEKGGGIYIAEGNGLIEKCIIANNTVGGGTGSGIMFHDNYGYGDSLMNCTLWGNMGDAAIYIKNSHPTLKNSIIWGNYPAEVDTFHHDENPGSSIPIVEYCDIEGSWDGVGNVDVNPLFCDTFNDDFHLAQNSPCLTAGEGGIAMGAFEEFGCLPAGGIYGTVTNADDDSLEGVLVTATSSKDTVRQAETFPDGTYEIVIPDAIEGDYADVNFSKPLYTPVDTVDFPFDVGLFAQLDVAMERSICGNYVIGDFNGSGTLNVSDIIAAFSKLKTGFPEPYMVCECPLDSGDEWAVVMDVNHSCTFNIADVIAAFSKLKTGLPLLEPCAVCAPEG